MLTLVSFTPASNVTARYFREPNLPRRVYRTHIGRLNDALHPEQTIAEVLRGFVLRPPEACRLSNPVRIC